MTKNFIILQSAVEEKKGGKKQWKISLFIFLIKNIYIYSKWKQKGVEVKSVLSAIFA